MVKKSELRSSQIMVGNLIFFFYPFWKILNCGSLLSPSDHFSSPITDRSARKSIHPCSFRPPLPQLVHTRAKWHTVSHTGTHCDILVQTGANWYSLAHTGSSWFTFAPTGTYQRTLTRTGKHRHALTSYLVILCAHIHQGWLKKGFDFNLKGVP